MVLAKPQAGMTFIGWLLVIAIIGFLAMFALKLVPIYLENFSVRSTLESLRDEPASFTGPSQLREIIKRRFSINNVNDVDPDDVAIVAEGGGYTVTVAYEVRETLIYNVDLVVSFDDTFEVPAH